MPQMRAADVLPKPKSPRKIIPFGCLGAFSCSTRARMIGSPTYLPERVVTRGPILDALDALDAVARGHERSSDARAGSPAIKGPQRQRGRPLLALRAEEGIPTGFNETERGPRRNSSSAPLPQ